MAGTPDDEHLHKVEISGSAVGSDQRSSQSEQDLLNEPTESNEPSATSEPSASPQPTDRPSPRRSTYIHPISEGGAVTWTDHNDLVYHQGKDRGQRVPRPPLPEGYKSKGPLPNFDFSKLVGNSAKKAPVTKFLDEYSGKLDQTPTDLVTKIIAYYIQNEDEHMSYLLGRAVTIQSLNDKIRIQEEEIGTVKEKLAETQAVKKYSAERGQKIKELSESLKDKEQTIEKLRLKVDKLEEGNFNTKESQSEDLIITLMARVTELEEAALKGTQESWTITQDLERSEGERKTKEQEQDIKDRESTIHDLRLQVQALQEEDIIRRGARTRTYQDPAGSTPGPSVPEMIRTAKAIKASLLESKVRCILLRAKMYMDEEENPAAGGEISRAELIMAQELPHLKILYGKVLYLHGEAHYRMGFLPEAIRALERALKMGFDSSSNEASGDRVRPLLVRARAAHAEAIRLGYPGP